MRYQSILALLLVQLWASHAYGSVSEAEPNSTVKGAALACTAFDPGTGICVTRVMTEIDNTGAFNPAANRNPTLATRLPLNDEIIGQLGGTRDYDWFYLDVPDSSRPVTPVYFGCDQKQGFYLESPKPLTIDYKKDVSFRVDYYYAPVAGTAEGVELQSSYVVGPDSCKVGTAETIGHMRFQMNTERPGRYYVRIWGRYIASVEEPASSGIFYDQIVAPTADYSLRVYTARIPGEQEPNDGMVEAFPLTSGKAASGQLSSMYDQDWFSIPNDIAVNTSKKIPFFFSCKGQTGKSYFLSAYDSLGVLQVSYEITADQCSGAGGFSYTIDAPTTQTYYFVVSSPTYTETDQFTQSDYTVLAITSPTSSGGTDGTPEVPTRQPGELEPNDTLINAYPLTNDQAVTAQLSSGSDQDFYYYDNDARQNTRGTVPIYFRCGSTNPDAIYQLSYFNTQGLLQKAYTVTTSQCSVPGGFKFDLVARSTARYFLLVTGDTENFSDADYTLSTFLNAAAEVPGNVTGNMRAARIVDQKAANRDSFAVNIGQCGSKNGVVKLSGSRLNLPGVDANTTVQVQIGPWACSSTRPLAIDVNPNRTIGVYPPPAPAPTPKKKITGLSGGG